MSNLVFIQALIGDLQPLSTVVFVICLMFGIKLIKGGQQWRSKEQ